MGKYKDLIQTLEEAPLSNVPFHGSTPSIKRIGPTKDLPLALGVHCVAPTEQAPEEYSRLHTHTTPELNILISAEGSKLNYSIRLGDETYTVSSPASVWIPAGLEHSANLLSGQGYFICLKARQNGG